MLAECQSTDNKRVLVEDEGGKIKRLRQKKKRLEAVTRDMRKISDISTDRDIKSISMENDC